jgi:uncharacterized protein YndB with AHSA1/START domain
MATENQGKKELTLTRTFNAPRELVWRAWTDAKLAKKWWGPRGVTTPTCEMDARPGGEIRIVMLAGKELGSFAGQEWPMKATFEELSPPERMVVLSAALDDKKGIMLETRSTLTLEKLDSKTKMTLHIVVTKINKGGESAVAGMEMGWNQSLDKLGEFLATR